MFTGIVEATGTVEALARPATDQGSVRLTVTTALDVASLPIGASIAVDGVCLTVVERASGRFSADLGPETLSLTTLGALEAGARVHLERPLRLGDPLGGHLVAGHVDTVGTVAARREHGASLDLEVLVPAAAARALGPKGSIAIDGVSLTINNISQVTGGALVSLTLIPHTLAVTTLGRKAVGSAVNIETDLIAKHVERLVGPYLEPGGDRAGAPTPARPPSAETSRRHGLVR